MARRRPSVTALKISAVVGWSPPELALLETPPIAVNLRKGSNGAYRLVGSVDQIEIPVTVQTVQAAPIDRLGDDQKQALQTALVIGKEFSRAINRRSA